MLEHIWLPTTKAYSRRRVVSGLAFVDIDAVAEPQNQGHAVARHLPAQETATRPLLVADVLPDGAPAGSGGGALRRLMCPPVRTPGG